MLAHTPPLDPLQTWHAAVSRPASGLCMCALAAVLTRRPSVVTLAVAATIQVTVAHGCAVAFAVPVNVTLKDFDGQSFSETLHSQ